VKSSLELFTGTAGGPPATSTARCEGLAKCSTSNVSVRAARAYGGRAARGSSEERVVKRNPVELTLDY